jgi:hypothetical protein
VHGASSRVVRHDILTNYSDQWRLPGRYLHRSAHNDVSLPVLLESRMRLQRVAAERRKEGGVMVVARFLARDASDCAAVRLPRSRLRSPLDRFSAITSSRRRPRSVSTMFALYRAFRHPACVILIRFWPRWTRLLRARGSREGRRRAAGRSAGLHPLRVPYSVAARRIGLASFLAMVVLALYEQALEQGELRASSEEDQEVP